jgi:hypothetical protein
VRAIGQQLGLLIADGLPTTEAIFSSLAVLERQNLGSCVATAIREAAQTRFAGLSVAVWLTDLAGNRLGTAGELTPWRC